MRKHLSAAYAACILTSMALAAPLAAAAQSAPAYAYASEGQIRGRVASFDGGYNLTVRDERGFLDNVLLHPGTIINPTGLRLEPGMIVSIVGYDSGAFFGANEVDTPYTFYAGAPYCYGHPWYYYGPAIGLGFFFGNPGWWHGGYFHDGYGWNAGVRVYENVRIGYVNRGWAYHGYDAPHWHGRSYDAAHWHGGDAARWHGGDAHYHGWSADHFHAGWHGRAYAGWHGEGHPAWHGDGQPAWHGGGHPAGYGGARVASHGGGHDGWYGGAHEHR
jgi:hypothetical protein